MGFNSDEFIKVFYGGQGSRESAPATGDERLRSQVPPKSAYDPAAARALLDRFGYKDRDGDGFREAPDGKPLVLVQSSMPDSLSREGDTLWLKNMTAIGLKMTINTQQFNDLLRQSKAGQLMMFNLGYRASEPSGTACSRRCGASPLPTSTSRVSQRRLRCRVRALPAHAGRTGRSRHRAQDVRRRQYVRAHRDAGQSGRQRVRAAVAPRLFPVAVRLYVEVHGHRSPRRRPRTAK
jgi:hypothetical protein